jgi:hypothetical protein
LGSLRIKGLGEAWERESARDGDEREAGAMTNRDDDYDGEELKRISRETVDEDISMMRRAWAAGTAQDRYPYRHHGPAIHGSKLVDFLISEHNMREDGLLPEDAP